MWEPPQPARVRDGILAFASGEYQDGYVGGVVLFDRDIVSGDLWRPNGYSVVITPPWHPARPQQGTPGQLLTRWLRDELDQPDASWDASTLHVAFRQVIAHTASTPFATLPAAQKRFRRLVDEVFGERGCDQYWADPADRPRRMAQGRFCATDWAFAERLRRTRDCREA